MRAEGPVGKRCFVEVCGGFSMRFSGCLGVYGDVSARCDNSLEWVCSCGGGSARVGGGVRKVLRAGMSSKREI